MATLDKISKGSSYGLAPADGALLRFAAGKGFDGSTSGSMVVYSDAGGGSIVERQSSDAGEGLLEPPTRGLQLRGRAKFGFLCHYFSVGLIYGGLPATCYGFLLGYMGVPSYVFNSMAAILELPWVIKFLFGALNDCRPILGYRRKPYMAIGWAICASFMVVLSRLPPPPPYYCVSPQTGEYELDLPPCHPDSAIQAGTWGLLMTAAATGYVIADVAADGLTVQLARAEPDDRRGYIQSTAYIMRSAGQVAAYALVGVGMNGRQYLGTFDPSSCLSFQTVCVIFAVSSGSMVVVSLACVQEQRRPERISFREYRASVWALLRSRAFFFVLMWELFNPFFQNVVSTGWPFTKRYWIGVQVLQEQFSNMFGYAFFSLTVYVVRERFLHTSWRKMLLFAAILPPLVDFPMGFVCVYDIGPGRNQYLNLVVGALMQIPLAIMFVVGCLIVVEHTSEGNEGLVFGLATSLQSLGKGLPNAIGNEMFGALRPALSNAANFIRARGGDLPCFRNVVYLSFCMCYISRLGSIAAVVLVPAQKDHARWRMRTWPARDGYAVASLVIVTLAAVYTVVINLLPLTSLACLRLAGGEGCEPASNATGSFDNATVC